MEKDLKDLMIKSAEKRKIVTYGNSIAITIPDLFLSWLNLEAGDEATIMVDLNKKGQRYIAVFKK